MNLIKILNTIHYNASQMYKDRIPVATDKNIQEIQSAMIDKNNVQVANEFMSTLINMLIKVELHTKTFNNPLKGLKRGTKPLGDTVEEIYTNFLKAGDYDPSGANLLKRKLPDTKTVFHRMNRKNTYKVTVNEDTLRKAFASYEALESYIKDIISKLYNSAELDEFTLTKQLIKTALDNKAIKVVSCDDPLTSPENAEKFIKQVKIVSGDMQFPNSNNNNYLEAQSTDKEPIVTFTRKNEQVLILDNTVDVSLSIDVLAKIFNMSVAEFNDTRKIVIDAFPEEGIRAALVDEKFFQIYDDNIVAKSFENPEGLYHNYYLHVFQTLSYSILVNGVVFKVASDADTDGTVETFTVTKNLKDGVTLSNRRVNITEGESYNTSVNGLAEGDTVTVTVNGTDVTSSVYKDGVISIHEVKGNIVITVA